MTSENQVFVGRKPLRVYVNRVESVLSKSPDVSILARGVLISRAILVADRVGNGQNPRLHYDVTREKGNDDIERDVPALEIILDSTTTKPEGLPPYGSTHFLDEKHPRKAPVAPIEDVIPTISG